MPRARSTSVRSELIRVALAAALPVWFASALLLWKVHADNRALIERDAAATARAVMVAVDRDLAAARGEALALATSPLLTASDLRGFHQQAKRTLAATGSGDNVVLTDAFGQQLLNTLRDYGEPLPPHGNPDLARQVFNTGKPAFSDLYVGGVRRTPVVSIDVPVIRDEQVRFVLSVGFFPERLARILHEENLPPGWVASIFDSRGVIVARTQGAEQFVGHAGAPALVARLALAHEGIVETNTLEGTAVSALFARSWLSDWAVAVGVPTAELTTRLWESLAWSFAITLALVGLSLVAARYASKRVVEPLKTLGTMAVAYGRGQRVEIPALGLREADDLALSLIEGSRLLEIRTIERDQAETQAQQTLLAKRLADEAAQVRSAYFAYLSHELRSPLAAILGCSELIALRARSTSPDVRCLEYCRRIEHTVDHLTDIVSEILDFAKFEARELKIHKEWLNVAAEVSKAVDLLEAKVRQSGLQLRCDLPPDLPPLYADRTRLRQILFNLVSNAVKFTPAGGTVLIQATHQDNLWLAICVRDTGIGIDPENLPQIMQPFAQIPSAQSGKRRGTGLGLPLTKGLVELHGGSFEIASTPGEGTIVTIRLPVHAAVDASDARLHATSY